MADDLKTIAERAPAPTSPKSAVEIARAVVYECVDVSKLDGECSNVTCILARAVLAAEAEREALERIASIASAQFSMVCGRRYSPTSPFKRLREALAELERVRAAKGDR